MNDGDYNPYAAPSREADGELEPASYDDDRYFLATPWQRWLGAFVDSLCFVPLIVPVFVMVRLAEDDTEHGDLLPLLALIPVVLLMIVQWVMIAKSGQSIGKRVVKTRIVRLDGSSPGFAYGVLLRSWVPTLLQVIPLVGGFVGLADALFVFRADRRTIHDHIAGTRVIQV